MLRTWLRLSTTSLAVAALAAGCSKHSSESPPATVPATFLFFNDAGSNAVFAVDPRNATTSVVEPPSTSAINTAWNVSSGRFDPASGLVVDAWTYAIAYLKPDLTGHLGLFKADAPLGATPPAPVQVSTLSAAVCSVWFFEDYAQADHSSLLVQMPGLDGFCGSGGDDELALVPLYLSSVADPIVAHTTYVSDVFPVYDQTGAIASWLMFDGIDNLFWEPRLLTTSHALASVVDGFGVLATTAGKLWLDVDSSLKVWSLGAGSLADPGGVPTTVPAGRHYLTAADGQHLYVGDQSAPGGAIVRVRLDGSAAAQVVYTLPAALTLTDLQLTTNRILIRTHTGPPPEYEYFTVPKGGGEAVKVFAPYPGGDFDAGRAVGGSLFFEAVGATTALAAKMAEDGSDAVSFISTTAFQLWSFAGGTSFPIDTGSKGKANRAILRRGGDISQGFSTAAEFGEAWTLRSFDAASRAGEIQVGALPAAWSVATPMAQASGSVTLVLASRADTLGQDFFLADLMKDDSVVQLTSIATDKTMYGSSNCSTGGVASAAPALLALLAAAGLRRRRR
jgi:MYXO-CTERM domain-containing protein